MREAPKSGGKARNGWVFVVAQRIAWRVLLASVAAIGATAQTTPCDATRWAGAPAISGSLTINAHASASGADGSSLTLNETVSAAPAMAAPPGGIPYGWSGPMNANVSYTMVSTDSLGQTTTIDGSGSALTAPGTPGQMYLSIDPIGCTYTLAWDGFVNAQVTNSSGNTISQMVNFVGTSADAQPLPASGTTLSGSYGQQSCDFAGHICHGERERPSIAGREWAIADTCIGRHPGSRSQHDRALFFDCACGSEHVHGDGGGNGTNVIGSSSNVSGSETVYVATLSPSFTSPNTTTFLAGSAGTFAVTTTGAPPPSITETGTLPNGVAFTNNGNGSGMLAGTAPIGSGGLYGLALEAANGVGTGATQTFTLVVNEGATITSANSTTFTVATAGTFSVKATGYPLPTLSENGALPSGVSFTAGVLSGTPAAGTGGVYPLTFNAGNGVATASQSFTLTVNQAANLTSPAATTFTQGNASSFTIACAGFPTATISQTGTLPAGVTFVNNGNGTATLTGTPTVAGTFNLVLTGSNGVGANAIQNFTLSVTGGGGGGATLVVSPTSLNFGNAKFGRHAAQTVTLTNSGTSVVSFGRIYLTYGAHTDKDDFELDRNCAARLGPKKSCTVRVLFEADDPGTSSAVLNIVDNVVGSPQTVAITATTVK